jgi:NAD(P)-dependent dehydrogenase (short-subunit alcohol dehydrogenase family)
VNTPQIARLPREAINQVVSSVPLGRIAEVDEIASAALFLASDESAFVTGTELFVDGGAAQV